MSNNRKHKIELNLLKLSWPMFVEGITRGIVAFTDTFFLSKISDIAASSIGLLSPVLMIGNFILPQFTRAGTSVAAQYMGAKLEDKIIPTYIANLIVSLLVASVICFNLRFFSGFIGSWLGMNNEQNGYTTLYLEIIAFNVLFVALRYSYSSILASRTLTHWNMIASVITNLLNVILNYLLMYGIWIFPELGVRGIALATVISYAVGFIILFYMVHIRLKISFIVENINRRVKEVILPILKIGIPSALEPFSYVVQNFFVASIIIFVGNIAMAAHTYVVRIIFLDLTVAWSLTGAGQIIMSHYLGRNDIFNVHKTYVRISKIAMVFAFMNIILYLIFSKQIIGIFTLDSEIKQTAFNILLFCLFMEPIRSINILTGVALKTVGDGKFSVIISMIFMWGLIPLLLIVRFFDLGIIGIWGCMLLDETIRAGINFWRWFSGRWKNRQVI